VVDLPPAWDPILCEIGLFGIGLLPILLTLAGVWRRR
jgi:hypothetical protein